jgi:hypothetical protein
LWEGIQQIAFGVLSVRGGPLDQLMVEFAQHLLRPLRMENRKE